MSENARAVAREVIKKVSKGQLVSKKEIIRNQGYSQAISKSPTKVTNTKAYKQEIEPLLRSLDVERQEVIKALKKTRSKAKYRDLIDGMDKITKNIQLLSGGATDHVIQVSWQVGDKDNK